jgi:hypothetical protein
VAAVAATAETEILVVAVATTEIETLVVAVDTADINSKVQPNYNKKPCICRVFCYLKA